MVQTTERYKNVPQKEFEEVLGRLKSILPLVEMLLQGNRCSVPKLNHTSKEAIG